MCEDMNLASSLLLVKSEVLVELACRPGNAGRDILASR